MINDSLKIENSQDIGNYLIDKIGSEIVEKAVLLVAKSGTSEVIKTVIIAQGGRSQAYVDLAVLFREVIIEPLATEFVFAHNHPSGNITPSDEDLKLSQKIEEIARLLGLRYVDNFIVSSTNYYSLRESGEIL